MRNITNSAIVIKYPDDTVFSGDLNLVVVEKLTTATHIELSFFIGTYEYKENLYFSTSILSFSLSEILELIFDRKPNDTFDTVEPFEFNIKLYNNTGLIDTETMSIQYVILGKRRIFDIKGYVPIPSEYDYDSDLVINNIYLFTENEQEVHKVLNDGSDSIIFNDSKDFFIPLFYSDLNHFYLVDTVTSVVSKINLNKKCVGSGQKIILRFKNRFGLWKHYYAIKRTEAVNSSSGISLFFYDETDNTEFNNVYTEENKIYNQTMSVYRDGFSKEQVNDFSDIIYTDYVNIYDEFNEVWLPVKVGTNTFSIIDKETLFDISLNLIIQSNNE